MPRTTRHHGRWTIADRIASAWHYLPVEVPAGSCGLRVELDYDRSGAVLDLGCAGPAGFRGWSGGARRSFVITPDAATPGYLAGELDPGTWQVIIGIHQLPAEGVEYRLVAEVSSRPGELAAGAAARAAAAAGAGSAPRPGGCRPVPAGGGWPATSTPTRCIRTAHRRSPSSPVLPPDWVWTSSRSPITTRSATTASSRPPRPGTASPCCPARRSPPPAVTRARWARSAGSTSACPPTPGWSRPERRGGLLSVNHPIAGHLSWTLPMRRRPPLVEVWHWSWLDLRWTMPLAWWLAWDPDAIPVGGSDWHRPGSDAPPGTPTTWVECAADGPDAVLDGLRDGRVAISGRRDGPVLLRSGDEMIAVDAEGTTLVGPDGPRARVRRAAGALPRGGRPPPAARRHRRYPRPDPLSALRAASR